MMFVYRPRLHVKCKYQIERASVSQELKLYEKEEIKC